MGDPAGIGLDISLIAWQQREQQNLPCFYIAANRPLLTQRAELLGLSVPMQDITEPAEALASFAQNMLPVLSVTDLSEIEPGRGNSSAGAAIMRSIEQCVDHVQQGQASALVTNPINKAILYEAGFTYPGHTEYLAALSAQAGPPVVPVMMIQAGTFRVVPLTIHIPLKDVPGAISQDLLLSQSRVIHQALQDYFGLKKPRIAVIGLNPHAGESGALGREEIDILQPAIERLQREGLAITGPLPADTMFHEEARQHYDVALAMYHDQALIPIKTVAFDSGVNITLGLPFIRTSPDHGTAYGIAGTGQARAQSFIAALKAAASMWQTRQHTCAQTHEHNRVD